MRVLQNIVVHCSATETGTTEAIHKYHTQQKGWSDIGYHYVIHRDGSIHVGRPLHKAGAHVRGFNYNTIGICLIGNEHFEEVQYTTLATVIKNLLADYPSITGVKGHREYPSAKEQGKSCPNDEIMNRLYTWKELNRIP